MASRFGDAEPHEPPVEVPEGLEPRVAAALAALVAERRTTTYLELARALAIPPPHHLRKLIRCLEALAAIDFAAGRPIAAALVVSRAREPIPAPGFFAHLIRLGAYHGAEEGEPARRWHAAELARVFAAG